MQNFKTKYLKDYQPPSFYASSVHLHFDIYDDHTLVKAQYQIVSNKNDKFKADTLELNGEELSLSSIHLNGRLLGKKEYTEKDSKLIIKDVPQKFILDIELIIKPHENKALAGLYQSKDIFITQCEPHGFRRIIYSLDRPDISSIFTTSITADSKKYPILLSNGNKEAEILIHNNHKLVIWHDPHPKPCYLFALVAGQFSKVTSTFQTVSGREVALEVYADPKHAEYCKFALDIIKLSMKWDEDKYNREYDLDIFMLVATADFNSGAMENKGLNIFNISCINAHESISTDSEFHRVASVIAHEYFHNWSGNRVTCRDWFQINLKEGLTVYREKQFLHDTYPLGLNRILEVIFLLNHQFPEDASSLAHPVQPTSYIEVNNFYTNTVYYKGSEIIRMMNLILGDKKYFKAVEYYFDKFDGTCATIQDFTTSMEESSKLNLTQFKNWYKQKGTPNVHIKTSYNEDKKTSSIEITQTKPDNDQADAYPLMLPMDVAFFGGDGDKLKVTYDQSPAKHEHLLVLKENTTTYEFNNVTQKPIISCLRGFSAPVKLEIEYSTADLSILMLHETDDYIRWNASQRLHAETIIKIMQSIKDKKELTLDSEYLNCIGGILTCLAKPEQFSILSYLLNLPSLNALLADLSNIDVESIYTAYQFINQTIFSKFSDQISKLYAELSEEDFTPDINRASRMLQHSLLTLITSNRSENDAKLCQEKLQSTNNITNQISLLSHLVNIDSNITNDCMQQYLEKWQGNQITYDKWLRLISSARTDSVFSKIKAIQKLEPYSNTNPNNIRSLIGNFSMGNMQYFHAKSGEGYTIVANEVLRIDKFNPQISSRLMQAFTDWRKFDTHNQNLLSSSIQRVLETKNISKNLFEITDKMGSVVKFV